MSLKDKRHISRMLALQYLYTYYRAIREDKSFGVFEPAFLLETIEEKSYNKNLYEEIIEGVINETNHLDEIISSYAKEWPLDQINLVSLTVLRMAVWEGFIKRGTPVKVVLNEAIELEKEFGSKSTSEFINGVLGRILNSKI